MPACLLTLCVLIVSLPPCSAVTTAQAGMPAEHRTLAEQAAFTFAHGGSAAAEVTSLATQGDSASKQPAAAQETTDQDSTERQASTNQGDAPSRSRRLAFTVRLSNIFSSNLDQDDDNLRSYGFAPGFGAHFQNRSSNPDFEIDYDMTSHSYANTNDYNRVSHNIDAVYSRRLFRRLRSETSAEISFNGSSDTDNRSVSDQYTFSQAFEYRLSRRTRLHLFGAYRIRRYDDSEGRDAINPYIGGKFEQRIGGGRRWEVGYRYDTNRTESPRRRNIRWTYNAEYSTPLFDKDRLTVEANYRPQLYARQTTVDGERVARRDRRWVLSAEWERRVWRKLGLNATYIFTNRTSNDSGEGFREHLVGVSLVYRFWWK